MEAGRERERERERERVTYEIGVDSVELYPVLCPCAYAKPMCGYGSGHESCMHVHIHVALPDELAGLDNKMWLKTQ